MPVLADTELAEALSELDLTVDAGKEPFDHRNQIQPASIDLRLDNVFWRPRWRESLGRSRFSPPLVLSSDDLFEADPVNRWKRTTLTQSELLRLRPGEMVLGRICERISLPRWAVARVEGKSSFARLGLRVHCTGGHLNPGYRGHMPLQLVNDGPFTIKVPPYIPVCQLIVSRLESPAALPYGDTPSGNVHQDDEGGPSHWWRSRQLRVLRVRLGGQGTAEAVLEEVLRRAARIEPRIVRRLREFAGRVPQADWTTADDLFSLFAESEGRLKRASRLRAWVAPSAFAAMIPLTIAAGWSASARVFLTNLVCLGLTALLQAYSFVVRPVETSFLDRQALESLEREMPTPPSRT